MGLVQLLHRPNFPVFVNEHKLTSASQLNQLSTQATVQNAILRENM